MRSPVRCDPQDCPPAIRRCVSLGIQYWVYVRSIGAIIPRSRPRIRVDARRQIRVLARLPRAKKHSPEWLRRTPAGIAGRGPAESLSCRENGGKRQEYSFWLAWLFSASKLPFRHLDVKASPPRPEFVFRREDQAFSA